ncbi:uronyl 2-sulfotransferase isoform X1 [Xyrauchen texanus]|uniref:uronyl 2-sulfotransferase isoform X1 n=1 Tax=Xyrauchen texanus TaxID=154827 RepID=UPI0022423E14|nr:uronyl 2-sulfotransferase isoform X1 [Xyrauchen texanus]
MKLEARMGCFHSPWRHENMMTFRNPPPHKHLTGYMRVRNRRENWLAVILLRVSRRDFGFCLTTLFIFCLGSVLYQLNGGAPKILLDVGNYLGRFADGPVAPRALPFPRQIVYNRVGKCGSRSIVLLLRMLADRHQFTLISSDIHNKTRLTKREQLNLMRNISTTPQPFLYTRHVHFLNFSRFRIDEPVYINIIRDPINRFLSNYFFRRFGDWRGEENHVVRTPGMKEDERYLDINTCILESYPECSNPRLFYIIPFFCGQHPQCREPSLWALETAKNNVLEHYLLVGVLEELEDVLLLLERLLPHFFSDVYNIYKSPEYRKLGNMTGTIRKHSPSLEALQVLYQRMEYEYKFYNFVKAQFHLTKRKIGLRTGPQPSRLYTSMIQRKDLLEELEIEESEDSLTWVES